MKTGRILQPFPFTDIRPWWHKEKEIDAVAINHETKQILFSECKWKTLDARDAGRVIATLEKKSEYVKWNNDSREEYFALFAKKIEGKEDYRDKGYIVFDLDDM